MGSSPSTSDMLVQLKFNFLHKMSKSSNIASARVKKDGLSQKNSNNQRLEVNTRFEQPFTARCQ